MLVHATRGFFLGERWRSPGDPPFEADEQTANRLIKSGVARAMVAVDLPAQPVRTAVAMAPESAEKAVARRQRRGKP